VCLAKLHEPLAKHEKNLVSAAELPGPTVATIEAIAELINSSKNCSIGDSI